MANQQRSKTTYTPSGLYENPCYGCVNSIAAGKSDGGCMSHTGEGERCVRCDKGRQHLLGSPGKCRRLGCGRRGSRPAPCPVLVPQSSPRSAAGSGLYSPAGSASSGAGSRCSPSLARPLVRTYARTTGSIISGELQETGLEIANSHVEEGQDGGNAGTGFGNLHRPRAIPGENRKSLALHWMIADVNGSKSRPSAITA